MSKDSAGRIRSFSCQLALFGALAGCASPGPIAPSSPPPVGSPPKVAVSANAPPVRSAFENHGGMWLPAQIPEHAAELSQLGLAIDPALLADPKSSLLSAIVNLNGCSASFVSKDGLVVTNHHCATGALQHNSSARENLLETGTLAKTRAEERSSGPSARLRVLSKMTEVSERIRPVLERVTDPLARELEYERLEKEIVGGCESQRPAVRCSLVSMYGGLRYFSVESLELRDIRIVYAPAESIGNFGGEVDNWRWPRHCGDVAFFRAYVGKDGMPADYSVDNVPYQPPSFLKLASAPLAEGDLVFVAGYPGRTSLLASAAEVRQTESIVYPAQLAMFDAYLALIAELSKSDPELAIKATSRRRGFDNYRTKHLGELSGMKRSRLLENKIATDNALQAFIDSDPARRAESGNVLHELELAIGEQQRTREADTALQSEFLMPRLVFAAYRSVRLAAERQKPNAQRDPDYQDRNLTKLRDEQKSLAASYHPKLDRALLELALQRDRARDPNVRSPALALIAGKDPTDAALGAAIAKLYDKTRLGEEKARLELFDHGRFAALAQHPDPIVRLAAQLYPALRAAEDRAKRFNGQLRVLKPRYLAALLAFKGGAVAPDANSTLRVAYGTVKKAPPGAPGSNIGAFTSLNQMLAKNTGKEPFDAPQRLVEAAKTAARSPYVDKTLGDVPVDFLSDLHITNGNSGSATLNARGELVGLAFDGTFESVVSDWAYEPSTRTVHVDLRFVLFLLRDVDQAQNLLSELGIAR
ncbi:MAG TPA: S46 family peptidase [Polyangiaceae bacterium]|nr:S46 family peptidase [Polyangiaceae bacterium]